MTWINVSFCHCPNMSSSYFVLEKSRALLQHARLDPRKMIPFLPASLPREFTATATAAATAAAAAAAVSLPMVKRLALRCVSREEDSILSIFHINDFSWTFFKGHFINLFKKGFIWFLGTSLEEIIYEDPSFTLFRSNLVFEGFVHLLLPSFHRAREEKVVNLKRGVPFGRTDGQQRFFSFYLSLP